MRVFSLGSSAVLHTNLFAGGEIKFIKNNHIVNYHHPILTPQQKMMSAFWK